MKTVVQPELWDSVLARLRGAEAQVWMYHATHSRLALRVFRHGEKDVVYIVAVGCEHLVAPFYWTLADLKIVSAAANEGAGTRWFVLDESAGFRLRCANVALALAPATDFDVTFDGFLGDLPREDV